MKYEINGFAIFMGLGARNYLNRIPDELYLKILYRLALHKKLNLKNPVTFNEKLQWLKLHNRKPEYVTMVDKYAVRDYIADKIGDEYLIPLAGGPWYDFDEIDFDALPDRFVLKCNHDSGSIVICKDKTKLDKEAARKKINKHLKRNFYWASREWPYKDVKPCIIAEQYMGSEDGSSPKDYKFYCFNGKPEQILVCYDRFNESGMKHDYFDTQWNHLPFHNAQYAHDGDAPLPPANLAKMLAFAEKLSADIPFIRCDFYEIGGKIYFGELTFYPASGMMLFNPQEWDKKLGDLINLA